MKDLELSQAVERFASAVEESQKACEHALKVLALKPCMYCDNLATLESTPFCSSYCTEEHMRELREHCENQRTDFLLGK